MDPTVLLLDEPVGGMNREETERFVGYVSTAQDELGLTIVLIEHDVSMVMDIADRVPRPLTSARSSALACRTR